MLKVKKKIHKTNLNKNQEDDISKIQNNLKSSIKNLYISDQKKKKKIDKYAQLITKIREEYAKLQQENNQLKIELHKYKTYVEQLSQKSYQKSYVNYPKPIRKRKYYRDLEPEEESDESDSYITETRRRPKKQKKRITYEDEIDGLPNYEPESPSEEEQEDNNEIQIKPKGKQAKVIERPKKVKKGITKSIKI